MIAALTGAAALAVGAHAAAPNHAATPGASYARVAGAVAWAGAKQAVLADHQISQSWSIDSERRVTVTEVRDLPAGRQWAAAGAGDFSLILDSVPTSSTAGWRLIAVKAQRVPPDPARPGAGSGVELVFRYGLPGPPGRLELDRTWSLYPGSGVEHVAETIVNRTPLAHRIGQYSLAELTSSDPVEAQIIAYHGGSDWRGDFRSDRTAEGSFDYEGEVARFDAGAGEGWFLVSARRGGAMNRVGRDSSGRTWIGVDNARDVFDWGPILSSPPNYNRQENPAYPAPVRQRVLAPLGSLELGDAYLGVYHGGASQAGAGFAADFAAHVMPGRRQTVDLNTFHPWTHGPGLSDANLRRQAELFHRLGGEVFMLDDQWQGRSAGDWQWDTARFPLDSGGVPRFVDYLHSLGLQLGLWMAPAEFNPGAGVYHSHPEWACTPTGDGTAQVPDDSGLGVWDFTNPGLRAYLTGVVDRLVAQDAVREFKFDYVTWVDCPPHDYLDYEDAYANWVRQQEARHPGVTFELDETNDQRLWAVRSAALGPSWFDNGHIPTPQYPARLLHDIWSAAPWIPPSSLGFGTFDSDLGGPYSVDYLMPMALLGHVTFWSDLTKLTSAQIGETTWWLSWYEAHRAALNGAVYEDTARDPGGGSAWAVFQPWAGSRGYLFAFRQGGAADTVTVQLQGLEPSRSYLVTDVRTGSRMGRFTGAQLESALKLTRAARYSAQVLSVDPAATSPRRGHRVGR